MEQVKAGADIDAEGEAINNVEKVLLANGIQLREDNDTFRDMSDVLKDVADKYKELGEAGDTVKQQQIVGAIAGVRQANMLTSMLDNWDEVEKAQNIAADSAGVASSRYEIYMQSIEAATNKFKTALQDVYMEEGFEELITDVINLGTEILVLTKNLSVLKPILDSIALTIQVIEDTGILSVLSSLNESLGGSEFNIGDMLGGASGALLEITNAIKSFEGNGSSIVDLTPLEDLDELVDSLERLYKSSEYIKHLVDQLNNFYKSLNGINDLFENGERTYPEWQGALKDSSDAVKETSESVSEAEQKLQDFSEAMDDVSAAMKEQSANGNLSFETMQKLIDAGLVEYLYQEAGGWKLNTQAMIADTTTALNKILAEQGLTNVLAMVAKGEYETAYATLASKTARGESITQAMAYIAMLKSMTSAMTTSVGGASSAVKTLNDIKKEGYKAEIEAIEKQKDALDGQKKRLEDQKKAYKAIIDAMKEKLRLAKEEDDYQSELEEKNKEIVDIDNQLLAMQFDNSEEANKRRLELDEERAKKAEELEQFQADRTYEIQIEALDREYAAFEAMIDKQIAGIDRMISKFDAMIDKINEMIEALDKLGSAGSGGGGGVSTAATTTKTSGTDRQGGGACFVAGTKITLSDGRVKNIEDVIVGDFVLSYDTDNNKLIPSEIVETFIHDVNEVYEINDNIQVTGEHRLYVNNEWLAVRDMNIGDIMYDKSGNYAVVYGITKINKNCKVYNLHTNHISHNYFANGILAHNIKSRYDIYHDGGIVGGIPKLKATEEFAKLLKGEVVTNDAQMKNFMNSTLPNLVANVGGGSNQNNIEMNFNVAGNLDKTVLPDIKNMVASALNDMQYRKGKRTNVSSYSV